MTKEKEYLLEDVEAMETMAQLGDQEEVEVVYITAEEETGFWEQHGNKVGIAGAGLATLAAGFTGGFFTGKKAEAKKRALFMDEVIKIGLLVEGYRKGKDTVDIQGVTYPTDSHQVETAEDMLNVIETNLLKDKKISEAEKNEWIELALSLATFGIQARQVELANQIIVDEEEDKDKK